MSLDARSQPGWSASSGGSGWTRGATVSKFLQELLPPCSRNLNRLALLRPTPRRGLRSPLALSIVLTIETVMISCSCICPRVT